MCVCGVGGGVGWVGVGWVGVGWVGVGWVEVGWGLPVLLPQLRSREAHHNLSSRGHPSILYPEENILTGALLHMVPGYNMSEDHNSQLQADTALRWGGGVGGWGSTMKFASLF